MRRAGFLSLSIIMFAATPGATQQIAGGNLARLRQTPAYQQAVIAGAYKTAAWLNAKCEASEASLGKELAAASVPIVVDAQEQPQSGSWIERIAVRGCDRPWQLNVLVAVHQSGPLATIPLLPGTTHADPLLEKDGALYAFTAVPIDPKGCKPIYVADTKFNAILSDTPLIAGKPGWSEQWTVAQCEKRSSVEMRFVPDRTGTTIVSRRIR